LGNHGNIWVFNATVNTYNLGVILSQNICETEFFDDLLDKL